MAVKNLEVELEKDRSDSKICLEDLKEIKEIKAYAFKRSTKSNKNRNYLTDKYSCGWSVCHCATYGCN